MTAYNPEFLKKNHISNVDTITTPGNTTSDETRLKLFDRNKDLIFAVDVSAGTGQLDIFISFSGDVTVDRIILQNHNLSSFSIKQGTGPGSLTTVVSETSYTNTNSYYRPESFTNSFIAINATITQDGGDVYKIGQIYIGETIFNIDDAVSNGGLAVNSESSQKLNTLSDGTIDKTFIRRIFRYEIIGQLVSEVEKLKFIEAYEYNRSNALFFIPYPEDGTDIWDGQGEHVQWVNGDDIYNYTDNLQANGRDVVIQMATAGGLG